MNHLRGVRKTNVCVSCCQHTAWCARNATATTTPRSLVSPLTHAGQPQPCTAVARPRSYTRPTSPEGHRRRATLLPLRRAAIAGQDANAVPLVWSPLPHAPSSRYSPWARCWWSVSCVTIRQAAAPSPTTTHRKMQTVDFETFFLFHTFSLLVRARSQCSTCRRKPPLSCASCRGFPAHRLRIAVISRKMSGGPRST